MKVDVERLGYTRLLQDFKFTKNVQIAMRVFYFNNTIH